MHGGNVGDGAVSRRFLAFHFALVQDVAVLRPLARLAASLTSVRVHLLVSSKFAERDAEGRWQSEIDVLGAELGVKPFKYESHFDCLRHLGSGGGMVIAGSESNVPAHRDAHDLFRAMPGRIRTVTLQHGLECVGFLHNARHDATSGLDVRFAADIAVTWFELSRMHSVAASERSKLYAAGPPSMIEQIRRGSPRSVTDLPAMICENLHSVRFVDGRLREDFLRAFLSFADRLRMVDQALTLRPHPAGRFTQRKGVPLPDNVALSVRPLYELDLAKFAYVISAPSTILFDFVLAGVPAATWVDPDGAVDASNFAGLTQVATVEDWWRFNWAARWERDALIDRQDRYVRDLNIPADVRGRYQGLMAMA